MLWYKKRTKSIKNVLKQNTILEKIIKTVLLNPIDYESENLRDKIDLYHLLLNKWNPKFNTKYNTKYNTPEKIKRFLTKIFYNSNLDFTPFFKKLDLQ